MTQLVLNQDQQHAADQIIQFLFSNKKEFIISGPAGTGKTTLMQYVVSDVLKQYRLACDLVNTVPMNFQVEMTATTNKATEVLSQMIGLPAQTIHSFMNLVVRDNYNTGKSEIKPSGAWKVHSEKLIFIDEASMIDNALYSFINLGTDNTCKIIYVGDHCQLAPVQENISSVYTNPGTPFVHLNIPIRNAGQPALITLCNQLRSNVENPVFQPIAEVPGVIDYLDDTAAQSFINSTFSVETDNTRILCYTNVRVIEYNEYIRDLRGYPDTFVAGENIINNSSFEFSNKILFSPEERFLVDSVDSPVYTFQMPNSKACLNIYEITVLNHRGRMMVKIPANRNHFTELLRYFARKKDWTTYFFMKKNFPDFRPKDASTVYKAQGSTFETVFLDLSNIGKCSNFNQVARMLYVGASRATTRLCLYGVLPDRFNERWIEYQECV